MEQVRTDDKFAKFNRALCACWCILLMYVKRADNTVFRKQTNNENKTKTNTLPKNTNEKNIVKQTRTDNNNNNKNSLNSTVKHERARVSALHWARIWLLV